MFNVGDEVIVAVERPKHGWGSVSAGEIGVIQKIETNYNGESKTVYYINFPDHVWWLGRESDLAFAYNKDPIWEV